MKCPECMGESFDLGHYEIGDIFNETPIVVRNVSGAKCSQCGFLLLPAAVAKEISKALALGHTVGTVPAHVFDLAEARDMASFFAALDPETRTPSVDGPPESTPYVEPERADNRVAS